LQDLALKLRAEGRSYDPKVFKKKKESKSPAGGGVAGAGSKHKKAKVKIKSSQRDKAPYHVSACWQLPAMLQAVLLALASRLCGSCCCGCTLAGYV
jgi:hypothetical protein